LKIEKNKKHKTVSLAVDLCAPQNSPATNDPLHKIADSKATNFEAVDNHF
jgi:hypothetical protein